jgi:transposase
MSDVIRIGIDLAKNVFELYGVDRREQPVLSRRVRRGQLLALLANLPACTIVMEACGGAHYWARQMAELGHRPKLIAAWRARRTATGTRPITGMRRRSARPAAGRG